jgi:hypothetical protein
MPNHSVAKKLRQPGALEPNAVSSTPRNALGAQLSFRPADFTIVARPVLRAGDRVVTHKIETHPSHQLIAQIRTMRVTQPFAELQRRWRASAMQGIRREKRRYS